MTYSKKPLESRANRKRSLFGILLVIAGALLMLNNFDIIPHEVGRLIFRWPMILIGIGTVHLLSDKRKANGWILIIIGFVSMLFFTDVLQLLNNPFDFDIKDIKEVIWPAALVAVGGIILFSKNRSRSCSVAEMDSNDYLDEMNIFGGGNRVVSSQNFKGGKITNMFGGSEIDLSRATPTENGAVLDVITMFGGSKILVPADWDVSVEVTSILGGFSDKRNNITTDPMTSKRLVVKGVAIFGGGEVKTF